MKLQGEGPKNSGVDVLFQNLKYGVTTSRDVGDFLRERCVIMLFRLKYAGILSNLLKIMKKRHILKCKCQMKVHPGRVSFPSVGQIGKNCIKWLFPRVLLSTLAVP